MAKGKKIPRKQVDALVALAALAAMDRFERGEADDEDAELVQNSIDYLEERKQGKLED